MNSTLGPALRKAMRKKRVPFRHRAAVNLVLFLPAKHRELEFAITEKAMAMGALPPEAALDDDGCYVGDFIDILDWLMANLPAILEMVMTIIALFGALVPIIGVVAATELCLDLLKAIF